ncbi:class I SAM-dependent methyltransferase [Roseibium marinum]|uniref:Ubiquinone/menaquinone biosynthesis C-methylase UbiE n=1 Tax=Roseibium marinum TaxID=281252 RepID=A0A2S3UY95_9HYPH|nr:class I SAM-dependent methyltransferase [Roseibium marinum]POF32419.1 ubiquinone/menaquinone biosynthesis C-methylase UbiE [Roseibium marinum]
MTISMNTNLLASPVDQPSPLVDFWNQILAPKFIRYRHVLVGGLSRHSEAVLPQLDIESGSRILDVGCGFGDTAAYLAGRTGPSGEVVGIDCCNAFLDFGRDLAEQHRIHNVRFAEGDIEQGMDEGLFDFVFARFGTMFFSNPVAGLRAMRVCLKPGGELAHIVWRQRADNPWLIAARDIVRQFLPAPGADALTCGPGPFSMADEETTRTRMEIAGFTDIAFKRVDAKVLVGRDIEDAVNFQLAIGPAGETFREAGALAEQRRPEIVAALSELFREVEAREGGLWMDSSSWLITARNPAI